MTWNENWSPFAKNTTNTEFIKCSTDCYRRLLVVISNINVLNSVSIHGSHISTDIFKLKLLLEVLIRHGQAILLALHTTSKAQTNIY